MFLTPRKHLGPYGNRCLHVLLYSTALQNVRRCRLFWKICRGKVACDVFWANSTRSHSTGLDNKFDSVLHHSCAMCGCSYAGEDNWVDRWVGQVAYFGVIKLQDTIA